MRATRRRTNHKGRRAIGEGCAGAREYNDEIRARRRRETNRRKEHEDEETTVTDRSAGAKAIGKLWGGAAAKQTEQALGNGNKLARAKPLGRLEAAMNL